MNENLNLVEKLKNVPKGTKLWSPICGDCILDKIDTRDTTVNYAIHCLTVNDHSPVQFTANGKYTFCFDDGECVLFPSKENHDWSTFKVTEKHKCFEPFQKILVKTWRDSRSIWMADFYSHYDEVTGRHYLVSGLTREGDDILPYKGNEDKLGTLIETK